MLFTDACDDKSGSRKKTLLLDVTLQKVYVESGIFVKAEKIQDLFSNIHAVVYCGRGVVVNVASDRREPFRAEMTTIIVNRVATDTVLMPCAQRRIFKPEGARTHE